MKHVMRSAGWNRLGNRISLSTAFIMMDDCDEAAAELSQMCESKYRVRSFITGEGRDMPA